MKLIYSIGIYIATIIIKFLAIFNQKLKLGVKGRKKTFTLLENAINKDDKTLWFHCASLGEYEQGLPVFERLKTKYPAHKIILSFFSPSGFEVKKNSEIADVIVYLPLDTKVNAKKFLEIIHPDFIVFVKYEIWPNFLLEIKRRKLKAILISAVFRPNQSFFKWYGGFMKSSLFAFNHIFTQNESSKKLLASIDYTTASTSGDTRFDRVTNQLKIDNTVPFIEEFKDDKLCIVFGSSWPDDDKLFINFINNAHKNLKFIIAPHNVKPNYTNSLKSQLKVKTVAYSEMVNTSLSDYNVFILDTIGYLNKVYSYADIAYVGGGAGTTGLHNVLEPAVYGIPVIIGKNYSKFPEAKMLIDAGGIVSVTSSESFESAIKILINDKSIRDKQGSINKNFIEDNTGAVIQILNYIRI